MADTALFTAGAATGIPDGTRISTEEVTTLNSGAVTAQHVQRAALVFVTQNGIANDVCLATPLPVIVYPTIYGGVLTYHVVAAATTNAVNIKAIAGQVYGIHVFNNAAYPVHVKLHNTDITPTAGAGVVRTISAQAGQDRDVRIPEGMEFLTGIGITIVKDITNAGTTAVAASDCVVDLDYK